MEKPQHPVRLTSVAFEKVKKHAAKVNCNISEAASALVVAGHMFHDSTGSGSVREWAADVVNIIEAEAKRTGMTYEEVCQDYVRRAARRKASLAKYARDIRDVKVES